MAEMGSNFIFTFLINFLVAIAGLGGAVLIIIGITKRNKKLWIIGSIVFIMCLFFFTFLFLRGLNKIKNAVKNKISYQYTYSQYNSNANTENIETKELQKVEGELILDNGSKEKIQLNLPSDFDENSFKIYNFDIVSKNKAIVLTLKIDFLKEFKGNLNIDFYDGNQYFLGSAEVKAKYEPQLISLKIEAKEKFNINEIKSLDLKIIKN